MSESYFATLPRGVRIRQGAVAVLRAAATIAGLNVQDSPMDPVPDDEMVRVNVFSKEQRTGSSPAGGRPYFDVNFTLQIQIIYRSADQAAAVLQSDLLRQQIYDALFEDPGWIGPNFAPNPSAIDESVKHSSDGALYLVEHTLALTMIFKETYGMRSSTVLAGPVPGRAQAVLAPLTKVGTTVQAGTAPGAGGQGTLPTEFTLDVTLPPP